MASCELKTLVEVHRGIVEAERGLLLCLKFPLQKTCKRSLKMAQRLVASGFLANRGLLVDALDRAYNASVCRPEFPLPARQVRGAGLQHEVKLK
jgi:hypothetical protein